MYELNTTFILHENKGLFPWHAFLIPAGYFIMTYANIWLQLTRYVALHCLFLCVQEVSLLHKADDIPILKMVHTIFIFIFFYLWHGELVQY